MNVNMYFGNNVLNFVQVDKYVLLVISDSLHLVAALTH